MPPKTRAVTRTALGVSKKLSKLSNRQRAKTFSKMSADNLYIVKNKAIKYLQITAAEFRRVCINAGVFPRQVSSRKDEVLYLKSDIKMLKNSNYLQFLDGMRVYKRKAVSMKQQALFDELEELRLKEPDFDYSSFIQRRYPTFELAIRDLSDCLCCIAACSVMSFGKITPELVRTNHTLLCDFNQFCTAVQAYRRTFVSVKGCYFEADLGQPVLYLEPFETAFTVPDQVEASIFANFCEFYQHLLKSVNFRLYQSIGLQYEPGCIQARRQQVHIISPQQSLFASLRFFVSRECKVDWICRLVISGGGEVVTDAQSATHAVFDKIVEKIPLVEAVSPQYVFDCFNCGFLLPASEYQCGKPAPAHLSPFEFDFSKEYQLKDGEYLPERLMQIVAYRKAFVERVGSVGATGAEMQQNQPAQSAAGAAAQDMQADVIGATVRLPDADKEIPDDQEIRPTDEKFTFIGQAQDLDLDDGERLVRARLSKKKREQYDQIVAKEKAEALERERLIRKKMAAKAQK